MAEPINPTNITEYSSQGHLFDIIELQEIQDKFSNSCGALVACVDADRGVLTKFSGTYEERQQIEKLLGLDSFFELLKQAQSNEIEELIVEETQYPNVKIAAIKIEVAKRQILSWLVCGILNDVQISNEYESGFEVFTHTMKEEQFYKSIELLMQISKKYFSLKVSIMSASAEIQKSRLAEKKMEDELKRNETMAEVVQLLESEISFEDLIRTILQIVGVYFEISDAHVLRVNKRDDTIDMIGEWNNDDVDSLFDKFQGIARTSLPFLGKRPYTLSSDTPLPENFAKVFKEYDLKAIITLPIEVNNQVIMYANFLERRYSRIWDINTIKFLNDVKKIMQSIVTKRITKNSLAGSYVSLEAILENIGCGIFVKDKTTEETLFVNKKIKSYFAKAIHAGKFDELILKGQAVSLNKDYYEMFYEEEGQWYDVRFKDIVWVDGREVSLCTVYDVTDKKLYQQKIEQQANNDFLTGLYNRMRCEADLGVFLKNVQRKGGNGALLYIDLDDFKHINDGLGHHYGDVLLKSISHSLQRIKGIEDNCYRMGGDEFIILVTREEYKNLDRILNEIQLIFNKPWFLKGSDYYCTMSMGIVSFPKDGETVQDLIQKADIAMYQAKKDGKNRLEFYDNNFDGTSYKRLDLEKNMRDATSNACKEFEVYYQPIFDVGKEGNQCTGAEALVRWNSEKLGFISPGEFIPLAEYLGLINPIGQYVLEQACYNCKYWNDMGHPDYKVNVNLSVVQLLQNDIVDVVSDVVKKVGINPQNLTLEVTESLAINDMSRMKNILGEIRKLGIRIALDDFGTGYSSLNHIKEIPLDVIKVDQSFVNDIESDEYAHSFVKLVSELASVIGVKVCIEGVEHAGQYQILKDMKVRLIQGYYFSKPLPLEEFEIKYL
ncbi:sensor domain-containing phosphodiesterase [Anaerosacchariphilus polymeriproducens]|uniref:Bifunctional diguanylate cyclase/phosphodiesterase n=1 Tax=Anaerosacchariphilus polymeriproducens TaxID=1812858 RepID=A0A371AX02_9FIRM|nr:bifunctional diguanylate cyclase/phosphodiesterase [Anaerosacchariphilus polymeriproducens]RDU24000.1 bifunctional diguanylate cyclase/phosphodiesterase [Anaerosacchariphilus polymeriproducens]